MMRTLITGSRGFTGPYVMRELESKGHEIFQLESDLLDVASLFSELSEIKPTWVVHLAGISSVVHKAEADFRRINVTGTDNLLRALKNIKSPIRCILLASSANVYGNVGYKSLSEDATPMPSNKYALSKLEMERIGHYWAGDLPIVIARPFNYTGVGQSTEFVIPKIVDCFRMKACELEVGNLDVEREFNSVETVAYIYRRLLETTPLGETINVCSGRAVRLRDVILTLSKLTKHSVNIKTNDLLIRANEVQRLSGDCSKLYRIIGEVKWPTIEDVLRAMLDAKFDYLEINQSY